MTDVPLLIHKSQKKPYLEPNSGMSDREIKKMALLRQIAERVTMSNHCCNLADQAGLEPAFGHLVQSV